MEALEVSEAAIISMEERLAKQALTFQDLENLNLREERLAVELKEEAYRANKAERDVVLSRQLTEKTKGALEASRRQQERGIACEATHDTNTNPNSNPNSDPNPNTKPNC